MTRTPPTHRENEEPPRTLPREPSTPPANIILFGFMGTGKTTVGKSLAQRLGWRFVDMDAVIEARAGKTIRELFAHEGEAHFRALEKALLAELVRGERQVIATGGGVVLDPDNIRLAESTALCFCLNADENTLLQRVVGDASRPLLEDADKARRIRSLLQQRQPLYARIAHQLDTSAHTVEELTDAMLATLAAQAPRP